MRGQLVLLVAVLLQARASVQTTWSTPVAGTWIDTLRRCGPRGPVNAIGQYAGCDPSGSRPCCGLHGRCSSGHYPWSCNCPGCIDYRKRDTTTRGYHYYMHHVVDTTNSPMNPRKPCRSQQRRLEFFWMRMECDRSGYYKRLQCSSWYGCKCVDPITGDTDKHRKVRDRCALNLLTPGKEYDRAEAFASTVNYVGKEEKHNHYERMITKPTPETIQQLRIVTIEKAAHGLSNTFRGGIIIFATIFLICCLYATIMMIRRRGLVGRGRIGSNQNQPVVALPRDGTGSLAMYKGLQGGNTATLMAPPPAYSQVQLYNAGGRDAAPADL